MTQAWVTFATNDSYALGALVLAASLRRVKTERKTHIMITDGVTQSMREQLNASFDAVSVVNLMESEDYTNLHLIGRPDLGCTFTKLHCWRLTQYEKCVFLDADTLVVAPCDDLFAREEFSAAADIGWPDCFNSGVFVFKPCNDTYKSIIQLAVKEGSFDGGDQGVLNSYFSGWRASDIKFRLSFAYNMSSSVAYTYKAAYKQFIGDVKIIHFLGNVKPWHHAGGKYRGESHHATDHIAMWWSLYEKDVCPNLNSQLTNIASSSRPIGHVGGAMPTELQQQRAWEEGRIDYAGKDSWENIQKRLEETLKE